MGGGKKKRAGKAGRELTDDEFDAALAEIRGGSDRVAAIMSSAIAQNTLVAAIIACLKDASEAAKLFDDVRGPFNTFYAQIVAGQALGLYRKDVATALHTVRQIRNRFAHDVISLSFADPGIAAECRKLQNFALRQNLAELPPRELYECVCLALSNVLLRAVNEGLAQELRQEETKLALLALSGKGPSLSELLHSIPASLKDSE
jgi:hypothetical protein